MNFQKKISDIRSKRIDYLLEQIERLKLSNESLKAENTALSDELKVYKYNGNSLEKIQKEYMSCIEELGNIREKFKQAVHDAHRASGDYKKKASKLLNNTKREFH